MGGALRLQMRFRAGVISRVAVPLVAVGCLGSDPVVNSTPGGADGGSDAATPTRACLPAELLCVGAELRRCKDDGSGPDAPIATCGSEALCAAGRTNGVCAPAACAPGELKCQDNDFFPCLADRTGFSSTKAGTCSGATPVCSGGACIVCAEGTGDCVGATPRKCVNNTWVDQTACTGTAASVCALGECIDSRVARWPMPNEPTAAKNPAKYTTPSANVVRDEVTGLEWTKALGPAAAVGVDRKYCEGLTLDGRTGWHMPSVIELLTLVDFARLAAPPLLDTALFPGVPSPGFLANSANNAVQTHNYVNFMTGLLETEIPTGFTYPVRCVRPTKAAPAGPRFTVVGNDVRDNYTGLTWPALNTSSMNNFGPALGACAAPFRMPTAKELITLVDPADTTNPLIDTAFFTNARADAYWSITGGGGTRIVVSFDTFGKGGFIINSETNAVALRCVK